jgi:MerR family redox-sensitive transcriptional activator SoxR
LRAQIAETQTLPEPVADCLKCGCMNFDRCLLLDPSEATH